MVNTFDSQLFDPDLVVVVVVLLGIDKSFAMSTKQIAWETSVRDNERSIGNEQKNHESIILSSETSMPKEIPLERDELIQSSMTEIHSASFR